MPVWSHKTQPKSCAMLRVHLGQIKIVLYAVVKCGDGSHWFKEHVCESAQKVFIL